MLAFEKRGVAGILDLPFLQHLAHDDFDVLVVDLHTLQAVDVLHFVDHVVGQSFYAHDGKNIMRRRIAVHDVVAFLDIVAFRNGNVLAFGHHVFDADIRIIRGLDRDATLVLVVLAVAHIAVDFRDDGVIFRATCLEKLSHTRQTTGDILGLGTFTRDTCDNVTRTDFCAVLNGHDRINRHRIGNRIARIVADRLAIFAHQNDLRLQLVALGCCAPVDHDLLRHTGGFIGLILDRNTADQVNELGGTGFLGDDRQRVGIPLKELVAPVDGLTFDHEQLGTVTHLVAGTFVTVVVLNDQLHVTTHDHDIA